MYPVFIAVLFTIARTWKQPKYPSTDDGYRSLGIHMKWNITQPLKRNGFESVELRWMNLEPVIQSEVSQKEKNIVY